MIYGGILKRVRGWSCVRRRSPFRRLLIRCWIGMECRQRMSICRWALSLGSWYVFLSSLPLPPASISLELQSVKHPIHRLKSLASADLQSGTSAPLYIGTSILATRNAVLALALTAPIPPNLSVNGQPRSTTTQNASSSDYERMRRLLRAGNPSSSQLTTFQPKWTVLQAQARSA